MNKARLKSKSKYLSKRKNHNNKNDNSEGNLVKYLDLKMFKIEKCMNTKNHNFKQCPFYHTEKDKRRSLDEVKYCPEICKFLKQNSPCPEQEACSFSHNKVEQAYHPEKYRNKFCAKYPNKMSKCEYGDFCSYAHSEEQVKITLINNYEKDHDFFVFHFKTKFCPYSHKHDRATCVYAHNWQDYRRPPFEYAYEGKACPSWDPKKYVSDYDSGCSKGMSCALCHGWKEYEFHPDNYKTQKCSYKNCKKGVFCPLFHSLEEKESADKKRRVDGDEMNCFVNAPKNRTRKHKVESRPMQKTRDRLESYGNFSHSQEGQGSYGSFERGNQRHRQDVQQNQGYPPQSEFNQYKEDYYNYQEQMNPQFHSGAIPVRTQYRGQGSNSPHKQAHQGYYYEPQQMADPSYYPSGYPPYRDYQQVKSYPRPKGHYMDQRKKEPSQRAQNYYSFQGNPQSKGERYSKKNFPVSLNRLPVGQNNPQNQHQMSHQQPQQPTWPGYAPKLYMDQNSLSSDEEHSGGDRQNKGGKREGETKRKTPSSMNVHLEVNENRTSISNLNLLTNRSRKGSQYNQEADASHQNEQDQKKFHSLHVKKVRMDIVTTPKNRANTLSTMDDPKSSIQEFDARAIKQKSAQKITESDSGKSKPKGKSKKLVRGSSIQQHYQELNEIDEEPSNSKSSGGNS